MDQHREHLAAVERVAADLDAGGLEPVLVGGMALVVHGSQRVTWDFDFLVSAPPKTEDLVRILYSNGLELASKMGEDGIVQRTVGREKVAELKVAGTRPETLFFFGPKNRLRVDLLIDHPFPAHAIAGRAVAVRLQKQKVKVALPEDLLRMKEMARQKRNKPTDLQDIEFLERLIRGA
jgi:hypothetical protein